MTQKIRPHINMSSDLDPTDDHFDQMYLSMLDLMSNQAKSAVSEEQLTDHEAESPVARDSTETTKKGRSHSISPDLLRAILGWDCGSQSA